MEPLRTIVESEVYARLCGELAVDIKRLDEQLDGVIWSIARRPEAFTKVRDNLYVVETFAHDSDDYVFVYYTVDGPNTCTLRWIEAGSAIVPVSETNEVNIP
jgi:hypothetical protein